MKDISQEFADLGIKIQISQEVAEEQWRTFAREYRVVGNKAERLDAMKRDLVTAIMAGDVEIFEDSRGVCVKQFVVRPQNGGPKEIVYGPPNTTHVARGGTDDTPLSQKWARVAASMAGKNEGELSAWLAGRDYSLMETVAQLFTSA